MSFYSVSIAPMVAPLLTIVRTVTTSVVAGKKTRDCFTNKLRYLYRDPYLDAWLPANQPEQMRSNFSVQQLNRPATFIQAAEFWLGMKNMNMEAIPLCITTLPTIESLIERQEGGEDVGIGTNGYANLFFVPDGRGGIILVAAVACGNGYWNIYVKLLSYKSLWRDGHRFFFNQPLYRP